jgi:hypothetical protein
MSIITDALKLAAVQEKQITKLEAEIASLKFKLDALIIEKAAALEEVRIANAALKEVKKATKAELQALNSQHRENCVAINAELKQVKAELKVAQKAPKVVPTNDALGQVKRKPGRPKKVVEAATPVPEAPATPEIDPRQLNIPDLGAPTSGSSLKGVNYEFV